MTSKPAASLAALLLTAACSFAAASPPSQADALPSASARVAPVAVQVADAPSYRRTEAVQPASFHLGVYAAPATRGVKGARAFDTATATKSTEILDFPPDKSWSQIEGQAWLLQPHSVGTARLEYSLPLVPNLPGTSLKACAAGSYNVHWTRLARNLVHYNLARTIVRPGWEFNGHWYKWSARGHEQQFVQCCRNVVTTMRKVTGGAFSFDWNPTNGLLDSFPAERAYPGDAYVDYIGDDVYDVSWGRYSSSKAATAQIQAQAVDQLFKQDHGVDYWATFARKHRKKLAFTEWGVTSTNAHGGGDNPAYIHTMFQYMRVAGHNVAYEHYFNTGSAANTHVLSLFPRSLRQYRVDAD